MSDVDEWMEGEATGFGAQMSLDDEHEPSADQAETQIEPAADPLPSAQSGPRARDELIVRQSERRGMSNLFLKYQQMTFRLSWRTITRIHPYVIDSPSPTGEETGAEDKQPAAERRVCPEHVVIVSVPHPNAGAVMAPSAAPVPEKHESSAPKRAADGHPRALYHQDYYHYAFVRTADDPTRLQKMSKKELLQVKAVLELDEGLKKSSLVRVLNKVNSTPLNPIHLSNIGEWEKVGRATSGQGARSSAAKKRRLDKAAVEAKPGAQLSASTIASSVKADDVEHPHYADFEQQLASEMQTDDSTSSGNTEAVGIASGGADETAARKSDNVVPSSSATIAQDAAPATAMPKKPALDDTLVLSVPLRGRRLVIVGDVAYFYNAAD